MEEQQQQDEGGPPGTIEEELGDGLFQALLGGRRESKECECE